MPDRLRRQRPALLLHARALLTSSTEGVCDYISADVRNTGFILDSASGSLDLSQPVGLMLIGIMNHIPDDDEAHGIVQELVGALAPGSFLAFGHPTAELHGEAMHASMRAVMERGGTPICARSPQQIERFFTGLELLEPGVVSSSRWRPEPSPSGPPPQVAEFAALGRRPLARPNRSRQRRRRAGHTVVRRRHRRTSSIMTVRRSRREIWQASAT